MISREQASFVEPEAPISLSNGANDNSYDLNSASVASRYCFDKVEHTQNHDFVTSEMSSVEDSTAVDKKSRIDLYTENDKSIHEKSKQNDLTSMKPSQAMETELMDTDAIDHPKITTGSTDQKTAPESDAPFYFLRDSDGNRTKVYVRDNEFANEDLGVYLFIRGYRFLCAYDIFEKTKQLVPLFMPMESSKCSWYPADGIQELPMIKWDTESDFFMCTVNRTDFLWRRACIRCVYDILSGESDVCRVAIYGEGKSRTHCNQCRPKRLVEPAPKRCVVCLKKRPEFGWPSAAQTMTHCFHCRDSNMAQLSASTCIVENCNQRSKYGVGIEKTHCDWHKTDELCGTGTACLRCKSKQATAGADGQFTHCQACFVKDFSNSKKRPVKARTAKIEKLPGLDFHPPGQAVTVTLTKPCHLPKKDEVVEAPQSTLAKEKTMEPDCCPIECNSESAESVETSSSTSSESCESFGEVPAACRRRLNPSNALGHELGNTELDPYRSEYSARGESMNTQIVESGSSCVGSSDDSSDNVTTYWKAAITSDDSKNLTADVHDVKF